jgi:phosphate transport system substrate-binding protein
MGGVEPVVNIQGVPSGQLKLTGEILADIHQGKIAKWSVLKIAQLNGGVKLPNAPITPVYGSDASGTTSVFTTYLSQVSESWKAGLGANTSANWPAGQGGKGNEGVAALDLFIIGRVRVSSSTDTFGIVPLEALASGLPVQRCQCRDLRT